MSSDTFTNTLVKKILGKEFIPRFTSYLIIFPDYTYSFQPNMLSSFGIIALDSIGRAKKSICTVTILRHNFYLHWPTELDFGIKFSPHELEN